MILDNFAFLSGSISAAGVVTGQAVNAAGSILGTNTMDLAPLTIGGNQVPDEGAGEDMTVVFSVLTAPTVGTSVRFQIIQADDAALSVNVEVINQTDDIVIAKLPAGALVPLGLDIAAPLTPRRYVGVRYINVGAIATASYTAALVKDPQALKNIYFKSGFLVS